MKTIQIFGSYFTNYSYARVNRGLALGINKLNSEYKAFLWAPDDRIDWKPTEAELKHNPELAKIVLKEKTETDIIIYNDYPKQGQSADHGLKDLPGKVKIVYIAWEETVYPQNWIDEINKYAHGVMAASTFTKEILEKSGIKIPVVVVPCSLDEAVKVPATGKYPINTKKKFKFLHISTGRARKGVDVLLKAYFAEFTKNDDVTLVIKSFPGPDNLVDDLLRSLQTENSPEVIHINNPHLTEEELRNLHNSANAEVYPSRAEGFGLPQIEAMYHGIPLIVTNYSAYLDFCNEENCYLVDYTLTNAIDSEMVNIGAKWAEPDVSDLQRQIRYVFENINTEEVKTKTSKAKQKAREYSWENSGAKAIDFINQISDFYKLKEQKMAVICPINSEDGIAIYNANLYKGMENSFDQLYYLANKDIADRINEDAANVARTWETGEKDFTETLKFIKDKNIDLIHIQYHSGTYFSLETLSKLITDLKNLDKKVYVSLHAVRGNGFDHIKSCPELAKADIVFIHNNNDFNYAGQYLKNIVLSPLAAIEFKRRSKKKLKAKLGFDKNTPIIAAQGLMNINKNIPNIISAINILKSDYPEILFLSLNAVSANNSHSHSQYKECLDLVKKYKLENNVRFFTEFLSNEEVELLMQVPDVTVFAYADVGESASDAIRKGLASFTPTIVTDIASMEEFKDEVYKIKDESAEEIAKGIKKVLNDKALAQNIVENAKKYIEANSFTRKRIEMLKIFNN